MNAFAVFCRHYDPRSEVFRILTVHSVLVAQAARKIALSYVERHPDASIDLELLEEASLLHDIGIQLCAAPDIGCHGPEPYIRHGVLGRAILEAEGLPKHALFCAHHTGSGMTRAEVIEQHLPIPADDYLPSSIEEKILCVADKLYSKSPEKLWKKKKPEAIEKAIAKHGRAALARWEALRSEFLPG